jgi:uncharacterized protein with PQ loop repeat
MKFGMLFDKMFFIMLNISCACYFLNGVRIQISIQVEIQVQFLRVSIPNVGVPMLVSEYQSDPLL